MNSSPHLRNLFFTRSVVDGERDAETRRHGEGSPERHPQPLGSPKYRLPLVPYAAISVPCAAASAFTLVELMVSTAIIGLIMLILVQMTGQISGTWRNATEKIEKFQEARDGFEAMTRRLSQATLNTNWEYLDSAGQPPPTAVLSATSFVPVSYGRSSKLRFVSAPTNYRNSSGFALLDPTVRPGHAVFFQAPFGAVAGSDTAHGYGLMSNVLNTCGYFVEAGYDTTIPAFLDPSAHPNIHVLPRWRSRLFEFIQPAEQMSLYDGSDSSYKWLLTPGMSSSPRPAHVLAENVLTLILLPKLSKEDEDWRAKNVGANAVMLSPKFIYDSTPPPPPVTYPILNPGAVGGSDPGSICPKNQLPPVIEVTMIAIDERSAERLNDNNPLSPLMGIDKAASNAGISYSTLFTNAAMLEDNPNTPAPGDGDLFSYEQILIHAKVNYRVFTSSVTIRGAKWSRAQTR